jgi:ADP-ribose pyrophosphatase
MPSEFKLLHHKTVLQSRVFYVRDEKWRGPNNSRFQRHTVVHPGAVAILPFDAKGRVLMIRQFRPAANDWLLEIPAGTLEKGEAPLACAKRELIEEIGFAARKWKKLGAVFTAPGFCTERIHLYKAWDLKAAFAEQDEDEHIKLAAMTMADVRRAIKNGKICDAKTMSALMCMNVM